MTPSIRRAHLGDVPDAVRMGLQFRATYAAHLRENPAQMAAIARYLLDAPHALLLAETGGGAVVGMLGLALVPHPLSGDLTASELFWWVDPPSRTGRTGVALLDAGERWAQQQGATAMHMVALASNPAIARVYEARGYTIRDFVYERTL